MPAVIGAALLAAGAPADRRSDDPASRGVGMAAAATAIASGTTPGGDVTLGGARQQHFRPDRGAASAPVGSAHIVDALDVIRDRFDKVAR